MLHLPEICDFLPTDWTQIERAFENVPRCDFTQTWLEEPDANFQPARSYLGYQHDVLWIYCVLHDLDIWNDATRDNTPLWMLGNVFEIFLKAPQHNDYFEFHVTPENHHLQLHWPDADVVNSGRDWQDFIVEEPLFSSWTHIEKGKWRVLASIPFSSLGNVNHNGNWKFSLCRYDVTRGSTRPILSSTSPHRVSAFHRVQEWRSFSVLSEMRSECTGVL